MKNNKLYLSVIVAIMAVFFVSTLRAQEQAQQQARSPREPRKMVGGPCTYKSYKGIAKIVSVEQTDGSKRQAQMNGGPGYEGYEIKFLFVPEQPTDFSEVAWAKGSARALLTTQYPLLLANSWYPSQKFLEKYNIRKDAAFACEMELITSGTCTPIAFKFGSIDTTDYLE